jgi:hypothetical protein
LQLKQRSWHDGATATNSRDAFQQS